MFFISLILITALLLWWGTTIALRTTSLGIPGPPIVPFLGSFPYLFYKRGHQSLKWYEECVKKYGSVFHILGFFGTKRAIVVSDPKLVKHFLMTNSKNYERRPVVKRFGRLFGQGIFNSRGGTWKNQRKLARPFFKKSSLGDHIPVIRAHTGDLLQCLPTGESVDIQKAFYRLTLRIICEIGFGKNQLALTDVDSFNENFNQAQRTVERNIRNPLLEFQGNAGFDQNLKVLDEFVDMILKTRTHGSSNLLDLFEKTHGDSREYMRDTVLNFIIAGRDTTATLLTWTLFCLALNPKVETRLRKELQSVSRPLTQGGIQCKYLRWVFDEVLRLYPPIPVDTRSAIEDDVLPMGSLDRGAPNGFSVPKGTFLVYSAWIMGRSPEYWANPLKFRPERWGVQRVPKDKYAFVPFHAGPQTCMGMNLAYLEASVVLIEILSQFRFELDDAVTVSPRKSIILTAKGGMWLNFTRIAKDGVVHKNHGGVEED